MGGVRTKTVKKAARLIVEKYYSKLTTDFATNKRIVSEVAVISSVPLRNKIAGYVTQLMRRIERGPVRGISLKLQEEERERRENYVPDKSIMEDKVADIHIDSTTKELLASIGFQDFSGVNLIDNTHKHYGGHNTYHRGNNSRRIYGDQAKTRRFRNNAAPAQVTVPTNTEVIAQ